MDRFPDFPMDIPATYRICVLGGLDNNFVERLWGLKSRSLELPSGSEQTVLTGHVADQAALIGILNTLYNMGQPVVSVERLLNGIGPDPNEANATN